MYNVVWNNDDTTIMLHSIWEVFFFFLFFVIISSWFLFFFICIQLVKEQYIAKVYRGNHRVKALECKVGVYRWCFYLFIFFLIFIGRIFFIFKCEKRKVRAWSADILHCISRKIKTRWMAGFELEACVFDVCWVLEAKRDWIFKRRNVSASFFFSLKKVIWINFSMNAMIFERNNLKTPKWLIKLLSLWIILNSVRNFLVAV